MLGVIRGGRKQVFVAVSYTCKHRKVGSTAFLSCQFSLQIIYFFGEIYH